MSTSEVVKKALIIAAVVGVVMVVAMVSLKNKKTHESEKQAPAAADTVRTGAWIPGGMQSAPIGLRGTTPAATALWQPRTWEGDLALARGDGARSMQPSPANGGELVSEIGR